MEIRRLFALSSLVMLTIYFEPALADFNLFNHHCEPLLNPQGINCYDQAGKPLDCSKQLPVGSNARCKEFYQSSTSGASCGYEGWDDINFSCQIACGAVKNVLGHRPFSATIYQKVKKDLNSEICSGTLVGDGFIITASHCVLDHKDKKIDNEILLVGLGPLENETLFQVTDVKISSGDSSVVDHSDLAVLSLKNFFLSPEIMPVCLPFCGQMDQMALRNGSTGELFTRRNRSPEKLKVKLENCAHFNDFCAGEARGEKCPLEIGTGITIPMGDNAHFIYGVLTSSSNPSCKNFRTFRRLFPFIKWINEVIKSEFSKVDIAPSTSTPITKPTTTASPTTEPILRTPTHKPDSPESVEDSPSCNFTTREDETTLTFSNCQLNNTSLWEIFKNSKKIEKLEMVGVKLESGFDAVEELPFLTVYILTDADFKTRPKDFRSYFPFYKAQDNDVSNFVNIFKEIHIDDGLRRFLLKPSGGTLFVHNFNIQIEKILNSNSSDFDWKYLSFDNVTVDHNSIPESVEYLHLSSLNITPEELRKLLKNLKSLKILTIHNLENRELKLDDLPRTLERLRLDRVNLTAAIPEASTDSSFLSFFSGNAPASVEMPIFTKLKLLHWGVEVEIDDFIVENFQTIFPELRQVAYFGRDQENFINKILASPNLEIFYFRIQNLDSPVSTKIMEKIKYQQPFTSPNIKSIEICVERKNGELKSRLLRPIEFAQINEQLDQDFEIPECGFKMDEDQSNDQ